jgi:hypothetical protein
MLRIHACEFEVAFLITLSSSVLAPRCLAQAVAIAEVGGFVSDQTGAVIAAAQVKITQTATQLMRTANTDSQGRYALPNLPVGPYQLEVTAAGFKTYVQSGIVLQVGNNVQINVSMQVGALSM